MTQNDRYVLFELGMCTDLLVCACSLVLMWLIATQSARDGRAILLEHPLRQLAWVGALGLLWHLSLACTGCYASYRSTSLGGQAAAIIRGATATSLWTLAWIVLYRPRFAAAAPSLPVLVAALWFVTVAGLLASRVAARALTLVFRRRGRSLRNVLLIGSNRRSVALAQQLMRNRDLGYRVVGFVDDTWHWAGAPDRYKQMLLGGFDSMLRLLRNHPLDEVILTLPIASRYQFAEQVVDWCRQQGIIVRCEASLFEAPTFLPIDAQDAPSLITLYEHRQKHWVANVKRGVDCMLSAITLLLLSPLLLLIACAVRLSSPGCAIFRQERLGIGKRRFVIYKFRTMVRDAETLVHALESLNHSQGPTFKAVNDPRITRLGSFLRKTSLDELPQLFNVLLGDMSLVGPRPLPLHDYNGFSVDWHRRRFSVKPGITGLWQISGRSSIAFDRWMQLDIDYIDRWSLWLDFKIMLRTIPAVLRGSGAM